MPDVLTDLEQATPDWLTGILRERGCLEQGRVTAIDRQQIGSSSQVARLTVGYSDDAPPSAPAHLLLKIADPELERMMPRRNIQEIAYYNGVAAHLENLPVVRCYDAAYQGGAVDTFHLLLDDPSATTHIAYRYSAAPPTLAQCELIVDTLASAQALCWDSALVHAALDGVHAEETHTGRVTERLLTWAEQTMPRFLAEMAERLPAARRSLYSAVGAAVPPLLLARQQAGRNLTLTQGDVHLGNFLYPRDPRSRGAYIIDWKRAAMTVGANDLAYMMALYWFPAVRERWEQSLLRRYHDQLQAGGVTGYAWADLWHDYRLSVLRQLFEAVWGWSVGQTSAIWWNHLERITLSIQELRCLELL